MKNRSLLFFFILFFYHTLSWGQGSEDITLKANFQSDSMSSYADLYGYVDSAGNEYAILAGNGISIVNIEDSSAPYQVYFAPVSVKDVKIYKDYLYGVQDGTSYMKIIDISSLPDTSGIEDTTHGWPNPMGAHNLFIDDSGRAFLFNSSAGNSGLPIFDLTQDPMNPVHIGGYSSTGYHDGYVRNDTLYNANMTDGTFEIVDVSSPASPQFLGEHSTPGRFTHACWLSENGEHLFTMDELDGNFVASYDVSVPSNIKELDQVGSELGPPSSPHNVYVEDGYLYGSYYADGVVVWDVSRPHNMIRIAHFDTYPSSDSGGYIGCWGVYPWLPSGTIIASDRSNGLFILSSDLQRGCYLEGTVTDASNGSPIQGLEVRIIEDSITENSELTGEYATGTDSAGNYTVAYRHPHYHNDTLHDVPVGHDSLTIRDVELQPYPTHPLYLKVEKGGVATPIEGVRAKLQGKMVNWNDQSGPNGSIPFYDLPEGDYRIELGKWGFYPKCLNYHHDGPDTVRISLSEGYGDDFNFDLGWQSTSPPYTSSQFHRIDPALQDITAPSFNSRLENDVVDDCGTKAYKTGPIDTLTNTLVAPRIDASDWQEAYIRMDHWLWTYAYKNASGDGIFLIYRNGPNAPIDTLQVQSQTDSGKVWHTWTSQLPIQGELSDSLYVGILVGDPKGDGGSYGAIDRFRAGPDPTVLGIDDNTGTPEHVRLSVAPVPFKEGFQVRWEGVKEARISLYDVQGRKLKEALRSGNKAKMDGSDLRSGVYILVVRDEASGRVIGREEVMKE